MSKSELSRRISRLSKAIDDGYETTIVNDIVGRRVLGTVRREFISLQLWLVHVECASEQGATVSLDEKGNVVYCRE